jgi:hypothetical protein
VRKKVRKFIGLKATTEDEKKLEAIRRYIGRRATIADALRRAVDWYCLNQRIEWNAVEVVVVEKTVIRPKRRKKV